MKDIAVTVVGLMFFGVMSIGMFIGWATTWIVRGLQVARRDAIIERQQEFDREVAQLLKEEENR